MEKKEKLDLDNDTKMQITIAVIKGAPPALRTNVILMLVGILFSFMMKKKESEKNEWRMNNIKVLNSILSERNVSLLLESVGFIQKKGKITLDASTDEIMNRLNDLSAFFEIFSQCEEEVEERRRKVRDDVNTYIKMPLSLYEKIKHIKEGNLIMEGTVKVSSGHVIFQSDNRIEWQDDELFKEFPDGTKVDIFKKGRWVEVRKK